jgi:hypothetical protein
MIHLPNSNPFLIIAPLEDTIVYLFFLFPVGMLNTRSVGCSNGAKICVGMVLMTYTYMLIKGEEEAKELTNTSQINIMNGHNTHKCVILL